MVLILFKIGDWRRITMLISWRLGNFKSVGEDSFAADENGRGLLSDLPGLPLNKLTILAGPNSSGKSSIIQSVLLLAQTAISGLKDPVMVLQGRQVRLGLFQDLCSFVADPAPTTIHIGWEYAVDEEDDLYPIGVSAFSCILGFTATQINEQHPQLFPAISEYSLVVQTTDETDPRSSRALIVTRDSETRTLNAEMKPETDEELLFDANESGSLAGASFSGIMPNRLDTLYDVDKEEAKFIFSVLTHDFRYPVNPSPRIKDKYKDPLFDITIPDSVLEPSQLTDQKELGLDLDSPVTPWEWLRKVWSRLAQEKRDTLRADIKQRQRKLLEHLASIKSGSNMVQGTTPLPEHYSRVAEFVLEEMGKRIKYLGPLRESPKAIYPLTAGVDATDVGIMGEFTAYVLQRNQSVPVDNIDPEVLDSEDGSTKPGRIELIEAVNMWLDHIGAVSEVRVKDIMNVGIELKVKTSELDEYQHLTHVGVGVSQILPIMVMCLLAPRGSILLLEQPELHLHPKVQSRLADFFVAMCFLEKQCIVETHGEHWINRLRWRIAKSPGDSLRDRIQVYFVTKDEGISRFKPVEISKYGDIDEWPKDFFDQSLTDTVQIIRQGMEKRKHESSGTPAIDLD
jgi:predicted ATPase